MVTFCVFFCQNNVPLKSSTSTINLFQLFRFLKQVLVKCGRLHFNIFEQQDAGKILACILDELCGDFILALDLVQVKARVITDCLPAHQNTENEDSFTIFQLPVANTVQSSVHLFLKSEHLSGGNSFFCYYCQTDIIDHDFSRVGQFVII